MNNKWSLFLSSIFTLVFGVGITRINAQEYAKIPHFNSSIQVDGIADNIWKKIPANPILYLIDGTGYPDSTDCSGYFKAFWNKDTLYVLIFAIDNALYTKDQTVYLNDGFEIYLDLKNSKAAEYDSTCYQFRFIPGSKDISGRWGLNVWTPPMVDFAIKVDGVFDRTIEAAFPLKSLGKIDALSIGDKLGFEIEILDNDGKGRDHVLSWNKNDHEAWFNPGKMGTIEMIGDTVYPVHINNSKIPTATLFPNPTQGIVTVLSKTEIESISITSSLGQHVLVLKEINSNKICLDIEYLQSGIYISSIMFKNGAITNYKILKK